MGSPKVLIAKPHLPMAENTDKKSLAKALKKVTEFFKKDKKKIKSKTETHKEHKTETKTAVEDVLETFQKLEIERKEESEEEDEIKQFSFDIIEEETRSERIDSHSSEDSGFSDKIDVKNLEDIKDDLADNFNDLKIDEGKKQKKLQTVVVSRAPVRNKICSYDSRPYPVAENLDGSCRQIHQVNKQIFSGGQVIEKPTPIRHEDGLSEIESALQQVQNTTTHSQQEIGQELFNKIIDELIGNDQINLQDFADTLTVSNEDFELANFISYEASLNPIEEFANQNHLNSENDIVDLNDYDDVLTTISNNFADDYNRFTPYPTPPHSEEFASPKSEPQTSPSMYQPNLDYILSPERSSPIYNSDGEVFQEIKPGDLTDSFEYPIPVSINDCKDVTEKKRDRTSSSGFKRHMKQYKELQKEISNVFSKKECCQINRKPCKEIFQEHLQKLKKEERMTLCYKVSNLELENAYGVLQHILLSLSQTSELEDVQYALFCLICEKVLTHKPALFAGNFGLNLLKAAALRCNRRPVFTRYLVQCVRTAIKTDPSLVTGKDSVFHEVDSQGDTLLTACARIGDACADVLAELVAGDDLPLFRIHHVNADGLSALHVACMEHSDTSPRLHTVHVLLQHAAADLWRGNVKSGDTALHLAVNSKNCDLNLIMLLFKHVDRKMWKKLAHTPNMCSKTPLEYAREATRSQVRQNHPYDVFEFLRKCRN